MASVYWQFPDCIASQLNRSWSIGTLWHWHCINGRYLSSMNNYTESISECECQSTGKDSLLLSCPYLSYESTDSATILIDMIVCDTNYNINFIIGSLELRWPAYPSPVKVSLCVE